MQLNSAVLKKDTKDGKDLKGSIPGAEAPGYSGTDRPKTQDA
jgi:hypothetical protein